MKRLALLLLLLPSLVWATPNYVGYTNWCQRGNILTVTQGLQSSNPVQGSFPTCTIQVNVHGGGPATIYSSNTGASLTNPFSAQAIGLFQFYVDTNSTGIEYDIVMSGGTPSFPTSVTLYDIFMPGVGGTSGVSSFTGDGVLLSNVASTGPVTATIATAPANQVWGNGTNSPATPGYFRPGCAFLSDSNSLCSATPPLSATLGGTGQNSSAYTGVAQVLAGVWSASTALANGTTATTQSPGDNSTKVATDAFVLANATGVSGLTTNDCVTAASATSVQTPTGFVCNPVTGLSFAAPTGTGVSLTITGDSHSSDVLDVKQTGGSNAFKVDHSGNTTTAGTATAASGAFGTLTASGATIGGASAVGSIGLNTTAGSNTFQTPTSATGFTWSLPAATGTLVPRIYTQRLTAQTAAISPTTMVTVGATSTLYQFLATLTCEGTSASAVVTVTIGWTDVSGTAQTKASSGATCTTLGSASVDQLGFVVEAQNGTAVTYKTTITNTPTYTVDVRLVQP